MLVWNDIAKYRKDYNNGIKKLDNANNAYRNGLPLLMTDDEYDNELNELYKLCPSHHILLRLVSEPRAKISGSIPSPFYVGSLDKIKSQPELEKWIGTHEVMIVSDNLDGISCIWNPIELKLYIPGDRSTCLDISEWMQYISFGENVKCNLPYWIRGELIIPKHLIPNGKLGRSIVNGIFHRKNPLGSNDIKNVRFVAFEIISNLDTNKQFKLLNENNIFTPWYFVLDDVNNLDKMLFERREMSEYNVDGLVIKKDNCSKIQIPIKRKKQVNVNPIKL